MRREFRIGSACTIVLAALLPFSGQAAELPVVNVRAPDFPMVIADGTDSTLPSPTDAASSTPQVAVRLKTSADNMRFAQRNVPIGSSSGISPNPSVDAPAQPVIPGTPLGESSAPRGGLFPEFGKRLLDAGIDLHGAYLDHFYANPSAGVITGEINNLAVFAPAIDFDLQKIAGIPGATIHFVGRIYMFKGDIPQIATKAGGFLAGAQTTPSQQTYLISQLTYEQKLLGDRLSFEVGRDNVFNYFFITNSLNPFTGFSSTVMIDGNIPFNPFPVWGGRATYKLTPEWYVQAGAFEANFVRAVRNGNSVFGTHQANGAQILAEVGYRSEFSQEAYPRNLELTAEWNTSTERLNIKGIGALATARNTAANYQGGGFLYAQGLQVVWRGPDRPGGGQPQNLAVFGQVGASYDKPQPVDMDAQVGAIFTGLLPDRPYDAVQASVRYQRLSAIEANYESGLERRVAGKGVGQARDGYSFELTGNAQITSWFSLRPSIQYVLNPDEYYNAAQARRAHDGWIGSIFGVVSLGRLLGTSNKF